jgi:4a-hydroxytetrahydrobiopterin dehydratase
MRRQEISDAVSELGWRLVLRGLRAYVAVSTFAQAGEVAARIASISPDAGGHLRLDVRHDRVEIVVQTIAETKITQRDLDLAREISALVRAIDLSTESGLGAPAGARCVQEIEIGIDAMDIAAVRPFWKAVLGYQDEPGSDEPEDSVMDPGKQGPTIWFQQMDAPRPQRNRIHLDVVVPHDEARRRIDATLAAGGVMRYADEAPAFWVLADPEGNEACVCTWEGRD